MLWLIETVGRRPRNKSKGLTRCRPPEHELGRMFWLVEPVGGCWHPTFLPSGKSHLRSPAARHRKQQLTHLHIAILVNEPNLRIRLRLAFAFTFIYRLGS